MPGNSLIRCAYEWGGRRRLCASPGTYTLALQRFGRLPLRSSSSSGYFDVSKWCSATPSVQYPSSASDEKNLKASHHMPMHITRKAKTPSTANRSLMAASMPCPGLAYSFKCLIGGRRGKGVRLAYLARFFLGVHRADAHRLMMRPPKGGFGHPLGSYDRKSTRAGRGLGVSSIPCLPLLSSSGSQHR